tara:strand:+ start:305 stop:697 length:393 start_codon:yes stop_codon:yes gene_type:complete
MKIHDNNGELIATLIAFNNMKTGRNFITDDNQELQAGTFVYEKNTKVNRHVHKKNERRTFFTSEAIVVLSGELRVEVYDDRKNILSEVILKEKDTIVFHKGGHFIETLKDSTFIEFKQGPYNQINDKEIF